MNTYTINQTCTGKNTGIVLEHDLCAHKGIVRTTHDSTDYRTSSDICIGDQHISVKSSGATLMSGNMCEGQETFDGIWNVYKRNTHSNTWAYITLDRRVYEMNMAEFEKFIRTFGRTERESEKNGGQMKIRLRKESKKMLGWLAAYAAA